MLVQNYSCNHIGLNFDESYSCYSMFNDKIEDIHKVFIPDKEPFTFTDEINKKINNIRSKFDRIYTLDEAVDDAMMLNFMLNKNMIFKANDSIFVLDTFDYNHLTSDPDMIDNLKNVFNPILIRYKYFFLRYNLAKQIYKDYL